MATVSLPMTNQRRSFIPALVRTGLLVGVSDAIFATTLTQVPPLSTPLRLWQGVASVPFGKEMLDGGIATAVLGLLVHFCVAFAWSGLFLIAFYNWRGLRETIRNPFGAFAVAAAYGMSIWLMMSHVLIPAFVDRPPNIGPKYWILLIGHIPFVALPMVLANRGDSST